MTTSYELDNIDKKLIQLAQDEFPLTGRPWKILGNKLGISEEEAISRLKKLYKRGIIRRIGPILDAQKIGLNSSALIAMKVSEDKIEQVAEIVNEFESVTHNYLREHEYNLWFTITTRNKRKLLDTIKKIEQETEIPDNNILFLPTARRFKIDVRFNFI